MARLSTPFWKIDFELTTEPLISGLKKIEGFPEFECSTVHPDKIVFDFKDLGIIKRLDLEFNLREFGFTLTTFGGPEDNALLVRNVPVS